MNRSHLHTRVGLFVFQCPQWTYGSSAADVCMPKATSAQFKRHADPRGALHRDGPVGASRDIRSGQDQGTRTRLATMPSQRAIDGYGAGCSAARPRAAHAGDGRRHDRDTEEREFAVDAPIAPRGVLGRQAQDKAADRDDGARTPRPSTPARPGAATIHHVTMPPQHRVRTDHQPQLAQHHAGQRHQQRRKNCPVLGAQPWAPVAELPLQDSELVTQREDLDRLLTISHRQPTQHNEGLSDGEVRQGGPARAAIVPDNNQSDGHAYRPTHGRTFGTHDIERRPPPEPARPWLCAASVS